MASNKKESDLPSFEEALEQLETIVDSMESGEVPLAEMVTKFEQGNKLLKACQKRLSEAEQKIEMLQKDNETFKLEPFPHESET